MVRYIVAMLLLSVASFAETYKVSVNGSNANDGISKPWKTINYAASKIMPGDTVIVGPGTYNEKVTFNSGNLANSVVPTAFVGNGAVCNGFDTYKAPNLVIMGFEITSPKEVNWTYRYAIFIRSEGVKVLNNYIRDCYGAAIHAYWVHPWPKDVEVSGNLIERVNQGIVIHGHNWVVRDNEVRRLIKTNMDCDYMRFFGTNILIQRNFLHGTLLKEVGNSHVDAFQTFPNNGWYVDGVVVDSNYCESFHQGAMIGVGDYANQSGYLKNMVFTNNVFISGDILASWGIQAINTQNVLVANNLFMNIRYGGTLIRWKSSATVQNNIFYNCHQNYWAEDAIMAGGYNILNKVIYAKYSNSKDIVKDPLMVNSALPLGADGKPFTNDDGFYLRQNSPAVNAGNLRILRDINNKARGTYMDIGPSERD